MLWLENPVYTGQAPFIMYYFEAIMEEMFSFLMQIDANSVY
jgi:hypothetical protein